MDKLVVILVAVRQSNQRDQLSAQAEQMHGEKDATIIERIKVNQRLLMMRIE